ncbi:MAG: DUF2237 domain-containing protein [Verrucomicrobia bacterium]|nr:DUF2237 domain-containing protein [Verrucomicrobiota bacterium]
MARNVLGTALECCCMDPLTGYYRNGKCDTGPGDHGRHTVCAEMTDEFLAFSKEAGNDLTTPHPEIGFPGLKAGDRWCLCMDRWIEAFQHGKAPRMILESTHASVLEFIPMKMLLKYATRSD